MHCLFFFAFQMPQESPHEFNDATNSSAPGKLVVYRGGELCIRET